MSLQKNRKRLFVKGLGNLQLRLIEPTADADFSNGGHLGGTTLSRVPNVAEIMDENGDLLDVKTIDEKVSISTKLKQSSKAEIDLLNNCAEQVYAIRYSGLANGSTFQFFCLPVCRIKPGASLDFKQGERELAMMAYALKQGELSFDVPLNYLIETDALVATTGLRFWISPRSGFCYAIAKSLDASGYEYHGTLSGYSDVSDIHKSGTTPLYYDRFDGVNDKVDYGDVLDIDATSDFLLEAWVRVQASNGSALNILGKKNVGANSNPGFQLLRDSSNRPAVRLGDGVDTALVTAAGTILNNAWHHVAFAANRAGNGQVYIDGAASGVAVDITAIGDMSNAISLIEGGCGTTFGQVDIGDRRIYNFGASGLPSDISTIVARHYSAEKTYYGL